MRVPYHKRCKTSKHKMTQTIFPPPALMPLLRRAFLRAVPLSTFSFLFLPSPVRPLRGRTKFLLVQPVWMCFTLNWSWSCILIRDRCPIRNTMRSRS